QRRIAVDDVVAVVPGRVKGWSCSDDTLHETGFWDSLVVKEHTRDVYHRLNFLIRLLCKTQKLAGNLNRRGGDRALPSDVVVIDTERYRQRRRRIWRSNRFTKFSRYRLGVLGRFFILTGRYRLWVEIQKNFCHPPPPIPASQH